MASNVDVNHIGPIPNIVVGTSWESRKLASLCGVHRPFVAGIHGRTNDGAYSVAYSGGYEDDQDLGDEFFYTGSGGRDLSGNKRTASQSKQQTLTGCNRSLAVSCNADVSEKGAIAENWKEGKPIRVIRSYKGSSKYCPNEGYRYDGIYKVVKYWPEKGKSGYLVWRYHLRRDDDSPAPWTEEGKQQIEKLNLNMQKDPSRVDKISGNVHGKKKRHNSTDTDDFGELYEIPTTTVTLMKLDHVNKKYWTACSLKAFYGKEEFIDAVVICFKCMYCYEVVFNPITPPCGHNACKSCLELYFELGNTKCKGLHCSEKLCDSYLNNVNNNLQGCLSKILEGYEVGR